jgi:PadR family transcriptional regulator, regulatory protein PadR
VARRCPWLCLGIVPGETSDKRNLIDQENDPSYFYKEVLEAAVFVPRAPRPVRVGEARYRGNAGLEATRQYIFTKGSLLRRYEILPGTLYLLILKTVARGGRMHGYEIADSIQKSSGEVLRVKEGSLYPALRRMLANEWLTAEWGTTAENRRARYYQLAAAGRKQLSVELCKFANVIKAITRVTGRFEGGAKGYRRVRLR